MQTPLFPLTAHLLPEGRLSLRIFEPRYIRMVKEACASQGGFVVCMLNAQGSKEKNEHIYKIGTYAKVIDFDVLDDGLLGITVEGQYAVEISDICTQYDELRVGQCEKMAPWSCSIDPQQTASMETKLKEVFERYPDLNSLYDIPKFDNPIWILHRWLELIPVDPSEKQQFLEQKSCQKLLTYLSAIVP